MTGDGLNDIVLVHNGRIDYWPNLGYGRFGKRITMANAPHLEVNFDPKRLFLADLNGTGCADLVYVDFDRVHFWFNQSGNRWSDATDHPGHADRHRRGLRAICRRVRHRHRHTAVELRLCGAVGRPLQSPRFLRRRQAVRPHRHEQQHGGNDAGQLCPLHALLPGGSSQRHAVDHQAAIPRAGRRQSGGDRSHQPDEAGHHVQVPPRLF